MSMKMKKTDPRVVRTRQMFKDSLISLFQERDLAKITIQDIAERATLNRVTFYLHFRDIDDLIKQTGDEILNELFTLVSNDPQNRDILHSDLELSRFNLLMMLEHFYKNAALYSVLLEKSTYFRGRMFEVLKDIFTFGNGMRKADDKSLTVPLEIIVPAFFGVLAWWLRTGTPYSPAYLAEQLWLLRSNRPYDQTDIKA